MLGDVAPPHVAAGVATGVIIGCGILGLIYAVIRAFEINRISLEPNEAIKQFEGIDLLLSWLFFALMLSFSA
jgi:hypothetical protein